MWIVSMTPTTTRRHAAPWPVGNSGRQQGDASWRGDGFPFSAACVGSPGHRRGRFPRGDGEPATLGEIEAIRNAWGVDVCEDPVDVERWSPLNPSRGQCGPTALVVHDLLGGWLCVAKVRLEDGSYQGYHWWNRYPEASTSTSLVISSRPASPLRSHGSSSALPRSDAGNLSTCCSAHVSSSRSPLTHLHPDHDGGQVERKRHRSFARHSSADDVRAGVCVRVPCSRLRCAQRLDPRLGELARVCHQTGMGASGRAAAAPGLRVDRECHHGVGVHCVGGACNGGNMRRVSLGAKE